MTEDKDDDIIELTQVVGEESAGQDVIELTDMAGGDDTPDLVLEEPAIDLLEMDGEQPVSDSSDSSDSVGNAVTDVSQKDLDAAIERVIEKKFSQTIEKILFEVMEKVIQKEIKEIKAGLQKDLDEIDNA